MKKTTIKKIVWEVNGELISGKDSHQIEDVVIDSRAAKPGTLFVALKGDVTDGHRFINPAYENGARAVIIDDLDAAEEYGSAIIEENDMAIIKVENSLKALQDLSETYLENLNIPCIAVTGSVGKTTTRDMLYGAMSTKYKTGTNKKNYNSETGLPLTLLSFDESMEMGVLEMGMDGPGQILRLTEIVKPEIGVITNIGISHIERLGSREEIFKAKMEIAANFDGENTLVINGDDDLLASLKDREEAYNIVSVGTNEASDYVVKNIEDNGVEGISFTLDTPGETLDVTLPIPGVHNAVNCGLAVAAASLMGVDPKKAVKGIADISLTGSRMRVVEVGGKKIIDDAYNAAPSSMMSAIEVLEHTKGSRRIAILGGINELGELSKREHRRIGEFISNKKIDFLITIGEMGKWIEEGLLEKSDKIKTVNYSTKEELYPVIDQLFKDGDVILLKASRSYELDELAEEMIKRG